MACQNAEAPAQNEVSPQSMAAPAATYYLVRHAEKELTGSDPALSPEGYARAAALAERLQDAPLTAVYSTDTRRTRETAADVLTQKNIPLVIYDGRDLGALARILLAKEGEFLVVGHSNTTGELASALGGEGGSPIVEASEYDRLYVVRRHQGANNEPTITTDLQRYPG